MRRIRGKEVGFSSALPPTSVVVHMFRKGFSPFLRGLLAKPFLRNTQGFVFLGKGCKILAGNLLQSGRNLYIGDHGYLDCLSTGGVSIGHNVTIREGCWLQLTSRYDNPGTSIQIGNSVYIGPRATLGAAAPLVIGDFCQIGANVSFVAENHKSDGHGSIFGEGVTRKGITVGKDVWIGNNAVILDGVTVGDGSVIGAGTVLTKSIPPRSVVVGVPGRVIKTR